MTAIEVTFLGTTATVPTKLRNHPGVYIKYKGKEESCLLFDCGEGTQRQIFSAGLNFMRINNVFITHWHADHFAGLIGLVSTMNLEDRKRPLNIFAPEAEKFIPVIGSIGYWRKDFDVNPKNVVFKGNEITKIYDDKEYEILSSPMKHGIPAVAYCFKEKDRVRIDKDLSGKLGLPKQGLVYKKLKERGSVVFKGRKIELSEVAKVGVGKKIVYSGDTVPNKNMLNLAMNADLLIHDATYLDEDAKTTHHSTVDEAVDIAKQANVKKLVLTHISRRYTASDFRDAKERITKEKNVMFAKDLMKVVV